MITNLEEALEELRIRLPQYLEMMADTGNGKQFRCFAHEDTRPSMSWIPGRTAVYCHSGCGTFNIFTAAREIEGLPASGPKWISETIPYLAEKLNVPIRLGAPTEEDILRVRTLSVFDIAANVVMSKRAPARAYVAEERNWDSKYAEYGCISLQELEEELLKRGSTQADIAASRIFTAKVFGKDKITFVLRDSRGRPVGFCSRNTGNGPKWINSAETIAYKKGELLAGLHLARAVRKSREEIVVVEGLGEVCQMQRLKMLNVVSPCGVGFTTSHILTLKAFGLTNITLCLDWDEAGQSNTERIILKNAVQGISFNVIPKPPGDATDLDEWLRDKSEPCSLPPSVPAFRWLLSRFSSSLDTSALCERILPLIANESLAVKREQMMRHLSDETGISFAAIESDLTALMGKATGEKERKILVALEKYTNTVKESPSEAHGALIIHQEHLERIQEEYSAGCIGVNYQLDRFKAAEDERASYADGDATNYKWVTYSSFKEVFADGMNATKALGYLGGQANHGKTAVGIALMTDLALHDEDAIVVGHFTDDDYSKIEVRLRSNIAAIIEPEIEVPLSAFVHPNKYLPFLEKKQQEVLHEANKIFKDLLEKERLVVIDGADGKTISALERNIRYYRSRYPSKKIFNFCDNTHNYTSFMGQDQRARMTMISDGQKGITAKYSIHMLATAEYRKGLPRMREDLRFPTQDDLADARALMYRPDYIMHVYQDLTARREHAKFFWVKDKTNKYVLPRIHLIMEKNKVSGRKPTIFLDMNPRSVSMREVDASTAESEAKLYEQLYDNGDAVIQDGKLLMLGGQSAE